MVAQIGRNHVVDELRQQLEKPNRLRIIFFWSPSSKEIVNELLWRNTRWDSGRTASRQEASLQEIPRTHPLKLSNLQETSEITE